MKTQSQQSAHLLSELLLSHTGNKVVDELQRSWHCETRNIRAWRFHGEFCPETTRKHPLSVRGSCLCLDDNPPKLCCTRSSCISVIQKRSHAFDSESCSKEAAGIRAPAPNGTLPVAFQLVAVFQRVQRYQASGLQYSQS